MEKPNKTATIELDWPILVAGKETSTLEMRRPTTGDMDVANRTAPIPALVEKILIGNLCMISPEEMNAVDYVDDYPKFQAALVGFRTKKKRK